MNLEAAWPQVRNWLLREDVSDWHVTMYCISPDFSDRYKSFIGEGMVRSAQGLSASIRQYIDTNSIELKKKGITLDLVMYQMFPSVHGIMFGNRSYLFHLLTGAYLEDQLKVNRGSTSLSALVTTQPGHAYIVNFSAAGLKLRRNRNQSLSLTKACSRLPTASALRPLPAAADARR